jgi:hypothetical protein
MSFQAPAGWWGGGEVLSGAGNAKMLGKVYRTACATLGIRVKAMIEVGGVEFEIEVGCQEG